MKNVLIKTNTIDLWRENMSQELLDIITEQFYTLTSGNVLSVAIPSEDALQKLSLVLSEYDNENKKISTEDALFVKALVEKGRKACGHAGVIA